MNTPVSSATSSTTAPQVLANLATVTPISTPAVVSHYNVTPTVDVLASVDGRDLGGVATDTQNVRKDFQQHLPRGTSMEVHGQVETIPSSFSGLLFGLVMSIVLSIC